MVIVQLHNSLANTMLLFMTALGFWGIYGAFRGGLSGSLSGALVIGEGLILAQALLGIISLLLGYRPHQNLHFLYGVTTALTFPAIYSFTRGRSSESQALWFGAGAFFIVGLAIRGITTGRV